MSPLLRLQRAALPAMFRMRAFHATSRASIKVGDSLPGVEVMEDSPGNKVSLAKELHGQNGLILGVPGAFSPACSEGQIQAYVDANPKTPIYVVAVNDPFVTKAWRESLLSGKPGHTFRFLADSTAAFSGALDMTFDATAIFGGIRSRRYALLLQDGKVAKMFVEPDKTGVSVTSAENVLKQL